jgi:hypothetical protein
MKGVEPQPSFEALRPAKLQVPINILKPVEGFPFEFELGSRVV